jgi:hypothetical protein
MEPNQTMKLIMMTYPGFQDLPKGVKKMLLASESHFFDEARTHPTHLARNSPISVMEIERRFGFPPFFPETPLDPAFAGWKGSRRFRHSTQPMVREVPAKSL